MSPPLRIGLAGLGTVGGAVLRALQKDAALLKARTGRGAKIVCVSARDKKKKRGFSLEKIPWVEKPEAMAARDDVDAVVELMGGSEGAAKRLVEAALCASKPVITANKALLSVHGKTLAALAEKHNAPILYEAALAAALPIVRVMRQSLVMDEVQNVRGILNGTCNHILFQMEKGETFSEALRHAQREGYAEADPSLDIDGHDAAQKLSLLSALAFGRTPSPKNIEVEGIRHLHPIDMRMASDFGFAIRLVASSGRKGRRVFERVRPALLSKDHGLARMEGTQNALLLSGKGFGTIFLEGAGAGAKPTASAVLSDLAEVARGRASLPVFSVSADKLKTYESLSPKDEDAGIFYIRLFARDEAGSMAEITRIFARLKISLERIRQTSEKSGGSLPFAAMTHRTPAGKIMKVKEALRACEAVSGDPVALPFLE